MTKSLATLSNSDMAVFSPEEIRRAGELLGVPLDEASAIKALIIQRDTGLSITRGEISIIPMGGKPTVFINKQGYLAYAAQQPEYDGYEFGIEEKNGDTYAWCKVFRTDRTRPTYEDAWLSEDKQPNSPTWAKMPKRMLAKVAIKRAHQAAFPVLNGLYDPAEAWDNSSRIEQRDDDIVIVPTGVSETAKTEPTSVQVETKPKSTPKSGEIYTLDKAQKILENYAERGFDTAVFDRARISNTEFDKTLIDADFKRQIQAKKEAVKEPESTIPVSVETGGEIISNEVCSICGKRLLATDVKDSRKFGKLLCPNCQIEELKARSAAKESAKQTEIPPQYVCSVCGKPITKARVDTCEMFRIPVTCTACENKEGAA